MNVVFSFTTERSRRWIMPQAGQEARVDQERVIFVIPDGDYGSVRFNDLFRIVMKLPNISSEPRDGHGESLTSVEDE
jgi:Fe-S-cluster formation regulator IscX/YfhJ